MTRERAARVDEAARSASVPRAGIVRSFVAWMVAATGELVPAAGLLGKERAAREDRDDGPAPRRLRRRIGGCVATGVQRRIVLAVGGLCLHAQTSIHMAVDETAGR